MSGSTKPQEIIFDPTPSAAKPLQGLISAALMERAQASRSVPGIPKVASIFDQLYGVGSQGNPIEAAILASLKNPNDPNDNDSKNDPRRGGGGDGNKKKNENDPGGNKTDEIFDPLNPSGYTSQALLNIPAVASGSRLYNSYQPQFRIPTFEEYFNRRR